MKRAQAVHVAAAQLFTAEGAVAQALRETSMLTVTLIDLQREAGLSPVIGRETLQRLGAVQAALHAGHTGMIDTHGALDEVKTRIGCRSVASGGGEKYDDTALRPAAATGGVRLVATA